MTTGHEAFIPQQQVDDLRAAGLAHIISISGLHMAIVGGFVFAVARLLIAAWPWLALRVPRQEGRRPPSAWPRCWRYLVLSGAPPPAERSAITAAVAFARDPGRPPGDQPACPGARGPGRAAAAAGGGDRARLPDVLRRHRRPGGAGRGLAAAGDGDQHALADPRSCRAPGLDRGRPRRRASWPGWPPGPSPSSTSTGSPPRACRQPGRRADLLAS